MATRTLEIDLRQGTGASSEPMYGVVTVQRAKAKSAGGFEILPFETTLKLINGKATITEAETDGTGPFYDSAYLFRVQNGYCAPRWGFMAALPDGSTPITTGELPMVDPITGEGIYMDAQEWNELYGDLPDRVSATETRLGVLDGLGQRGYTVDQSVGRVVKVWDYLNNREQLIYGDTGSRKISTLFPDRVSGDAFIRRSGNVVTMELDLLILSGSGTYTHAGLVPYGFRPTGAAYGIAMHLNAVADMHRYNISSAGNWSLYYYATGRWLRSTLSWITSDPWPTSLPGSAA